MMNKRKWTRRATLRRAFPDAVCVGINELGGGQTVTFAHHQSEDGFFGFQTIEEARAFVAEAPNTRALWYY